MAASADRPKPFESLLNQLAPYFLAALIILGLFDLPILNIVLTTASLLILLGLILRQNSMRKLSGPNLVDLSVFLLLISEVVGLSQSINQANSIPYFVEFVFMLTFYFIVRLNQQGERQKLILFFIITILGAILAYMAISGFFPLYKRLSSFGFDDFSNFKRRIRLQNPLGLVTGEWVTIFILLLPFPLILFTKYQANYLNQKPHQLNPRKKPLNTPRPGSSGKNQRKPLTWRITKGLQRLAARMKSSHTGRPEVLSWLLIIPVLAILIAGLITLSRGVLLAYLCFFLVAGLLFVINKLVTLKKTFIYVLSLFLLLGVILIPILPSMRTTLSFLKTTSQVRSFEGRSDVWEQSLEIVKAHPFFGVGANNFALSYLKYKSQDDDAQFIGSAYNTFMQILVEKGILGFIAYGFLFVAYFKVSLNKIKLLRGDIVKSASLIFFTSAVAAVIVRDLSYSSMFVNKEASMFLWYVFAYSAGLEERGEASHEPKS